MRGKVTHRRPRNVDGFLNVPAIPGQTNRRLEIALGRELSEAELSRAARIVESARYWRKRSTLRASAEDIKATLRSLAVVPDVGAAFDACDPTTRALVFEVIAEQPGLTVAAAAEIAFRKLRSRRGPKQTPLKLLADNALGLWRDCGGSGSAAARPARTLTESDSYATPLVRFAAAIFAAAGEQRSESEIAKLLKSVGGK
jgi:hypothetical protein